MSNEREQLIARLRRLGTVLDASGGAYATYDTETCELAIAALSAPPAEPQELPATVKECLPVAAKLLRELKASLRHGPDESTCYACDQAKAIDTVLATLDPKEGEQT